MNKPRIIKDYDKLDLTVQEKIKLQYPRGFERHLIRFKNRDGKYVSALPFEADDYYYLVRMTNAEAKEIIEEDSDFDEDGHLKDNIQEEYADKYEDPDEDRNNEDDN